MALGTRIRTAAVVSAAAIGVAFLALTFAPHFLALHDKAPPTSEAVWNKTSHDFGRVAVGAPLRCTFSVANRGRTPLELKDVKGSCGCLVGRIGKSLLEPGESSTIDVELVTLGQRPPQEIHKSLTAALQQGGNTATVVLRVAARLEPDLSVLPAELVYSGELNEGVRRNALCIKRNMLSPEAFASLEFRTPSPNCRIQITSRDQDTISLKTTWIQDPPAAQIMGPLEIHYTKQGQEQCEYVAQRLSVPNGAAAGTSPGWYFCRIAADVDAQTIKEKTLQSVQFHPQTLQNPVIRSVVVSGDAQRVVSWRIDEKAASHVDVWVREKPYNTRIIRGDLTVVFSDANSDASAPIQLKLPVCLVCEGAQPLRSNEHIAQAVHR